MINWQDLHHSQLSAADLYAVLALRNAVFVVEQHCPYQDIDGQDLCGENRHILGWRDNVLVAYARILLSTDPLAPLIIGRVIVCSSFRGEKLGYPLMTEALRSCQLHWPDKTVYLAAQAHLQNFYARFGFTPVTQPYEEDGILHIGMANHPLPGKKPVLTYN